MGEITKEEREALKKIVSTEELWKKNIRIIKDYKQFRITIPRVYADLLKIDHDKDYFEFSLIPDKDNKDKFVLEAKLIKK